MYTLYLMYAYVYIHIHLQCMYIHTYIHIHLQCVYIHIHLQCMYIHTYIHIHFQCVYIHIHLQNVALIHNTCTHHLYWIHADFAKTRIYTYICICTIFVCIGYINVLIYTFIHIYSNVHVQSVYLYVFTYLYCIFAHICTTNIYAYPKNLCSRILLKETFFNTCMYINMCIHTHINIYVII